MHADSRSTVIRPAQLGCIAASVFMVATPLASVAVPYLSPHDFSRLLQMVVMLVCALCVWRMALTSPLRPPLRVALPVAALMLMAGASAWLAASPMHALREISVFAGLICIAVCFAAVGRGFTVRVALPLLGVGAACYALLLVLVVVMAAASDQFSHLAAAELFIGFDNYRFYNHVQTVCLPLLALAASPLNTQRVTRWVSFIGLACSFALLWLSGGRATMLAVCFAVLAVTVLAGPSGRRFTRKMGYAALIGGALSVVLTYAFDLPAYVRTMSDTSSAHARLFLWGLAWDQIQSAPWLGLGPMHYAGVANVEAAHPHNIYLQIAAEWGLPAFLLLLLAAGYALYTLGRTVRTAQDGDTRLLGAGLWAACLAIAIDGLFSGNFVMPLSQCWIAAALGLAVGWQNQAVQKDPPAPAPGAGATGLQASVRWLGLLLVVLQFCLIQDVWQEATDLQTHLERVHQQVANERSNPRFWSHGWFSP